MIKLILVSAFFLFTADWGLVIEGKLTMGEGSTSEALYLRAPATQISVKDSIETGSKIGRSTGVQRPDPPESPPLIVSGLMKDSLYSINTSAMARDAPSYIKAGIPQPSVPMDEVIAFAFREFEHDLMFKIEDGLADQIKYVGRDALLARVEAFYGCFRIIMRKYFVYNKTFDREDQFQLLLYGIPAVSILEQAGFSWNNFSIGGDEEPLEFISKGDDFDRMMYKLISSELFCYYPFTSMYPFAPKLNSFPPEFIYPYIGEIIKSSRNKRLRRNAVYYLGTLNKYEPLKDLFEFLGDDSEDRIIRARALYFLTKARFPGLVDYLVSKVGLEEDPVFRVAYINSLGILRDKRAFPFLVRILEETAPDYDTYMAVVRSAIRCMESDNGEVKEKFIKRCHEIINDNGQWINDPHSKYSVINPQNGVEADGEYGLLRTSTGADIKSILVTTDGSIKDTRKKLLGQLVETAIIVAGADERKEKEALLRIQEVIQALKSVAGRNLTGAAPLDRSGWDRTLQGFITESVNGLSYGKNEAGKQMLEKMILTGNSRPEVLLYAIDSYYRDYQDDFERLAEEALKERDISTVVADRIIRYLYKGDVKSRTIVKALERIVLGYKPDMSYEEKHLIALSIPYLACEKEVSEKVLSTILTGELAVANKPDDSVIPSAVSVLNFRLSPKILLAEAVIYSLGLLNTKTAEKALKKFSPARDDNIRVYIAKALGNYKSKGSRKLLLKLLEDGDGWVRLNAYMSLFRITGKEYRVDWYFTGEKGIRNFLAEYYDMIGSGAN